MQNIKNFTLYENPDYSLTTIESTVTPLLLRSECGQDWYDCQRLFADNTVKIAYDSRGIIRSVVDKPVPQRGNIYAVSMLFPLNLSVTEIAVDDYPEGVKLDGTWKFDGERVCQDTDSVSAKNLAANIARRDRYLIDAIRLISTIQCSAAVGNPRDGDSSNLLALQQYVDQLRDVNISHPDWPPAPALTR